MANDYTWQELFRRLGLEARPQTGYYYKSQPNPWGVPNNTLVFKNKPLMSTEFLKDVEPIGFPNRELLLYGGGYDKQPKFVQDLLTRRNPLTKHLKNISPFLESKNMMWDFPGTMTKGPNSINKEIYLIENEYLHKPMKYKVPTQTLGMMGSKIMTTPGVKPTLKFLGRTAIPLAILDGLTSPVSNDIEGMNNYNAIKGLPLQGGIKYYGE